VSILFPHGFWPSFAREGVEQIRIVHHRHPDGLLCTLAVPNYRGSSHASACNVPSTLQGIFNNSYSYIISNPGF
jgi:hypothetical protein